jgi:alkanesulfonate monooxygenase SsuD/methylene tetrahydromethanopterin reductase-like flavin-dependent oxidoreductase (luciferase family)
MNSRTALKFGIFDWVEHRDEPLDSVFEGRLEMLELAEESGFFAYHIAEHQGTPLSLDTSPAILLAAASQRTRRLRLGALVFCLPWYDPLRLYNEICVLDQLSKGRLEVGLGRGVSPIEAAYYGVTSTAQAREMFAESLQVLVQAFKNARLDFEGKHYHYEGVELWNRPYQRPYPPLWYPTSNIESVPYVAAQGFNTSHNFAPNDVAKPYMELYWREWSAHKDDPDRLNGHVASPLVSNTRHVYVAPTDEQAVAEAREPFGLWSHHISYLSGRFSDRPVDSLALERRMANGTALVGSPATVSAAIREMVEQTGINYFLGVFNFGNLPQDKVMRSLELFAREVMPALETARR